MITKFVKEFFKWFVIINTGVLLIFAINTMRYDYIRVIYLWEIFEASAVTSLITTVFFAIDPKKEIPKYVQILTVLGHYLCLFGTMLFFGYSFGWIPLDVQGVISMALSVAGVYLCTVVLLAIIENKDAKEMNEALSEFREE